jgi:hypothetical protein
MRFELDVDKLRRGHDYFLARQERVIGAALARAGDEAVEHVQRYPEFKPGPKHALQRATKARVIRTANGRLLQLTNAKPYAKAIEFGSPEHDIVPRRKKLLRFIGRDGKTVFARRVRHPGNKPYRFLYNAHDAANRLFRTDLTRRLGELANAF